MKLEKICYSAEETKLFAKEFAKKINPGDVLAFKGDMGAGKTTFISALAEGLGCNGEPCSPTFAIVNEYPGDITLAHFDWYRLEDEDELLTTGYYDYLESGGICFAEWCEKIEPYLPDTFYTVTIRKCENDTESRAITITKETR